MRKAAASPAPLYGRIREALHARILDGTYAAGARLPTEQLLCESFGASRITIRQALEQLRRVGLVYKVHGQGTFVSAPRASQDISALQSFSEAMTPMGHHVANRLDGVRYLKAGKELRSRLHLDAGDRVAEITRVRLLDGAAVSFERTYLDEALGSQLESADLVTRDLFHVIEQDCRIRIGYANVAIHSIPAGDDVADALAVPLGSPVLCIERHVFDSADAPILFEYLNFRGDAFQYQVQINRSRPGRTRAAKQ
jgi:GntR family transcriptional regulator